MIRFTLSKYDILHFMIHIVNFGLLTFGIYQRHHDWFYGIFFLSEYSASIQRMKIRNEVLLFYYEWVFILTLIFIVFVSFWHQRNEYSIFTDICMIVLEIKLRFLRDFITFLSCIVVESDIWFIQIIWSVHEHAREVES